MFLVFLEGMLMSTQKQRRASRLPASIITVGCFLALTIAFAPAQAPDATLRITSRMVSSGIGLSWGEGVLTYQNKDYPFTFHASGRLREVDVKTTAAELSGQVFNLKKAEDFSGNYKSVDAEKPVGGGTRATIRNQKGVMVNLMSTVEGRTFSVAREGMDIEFKKPKP